MQNEEQKDQQPVTAAIDGNTMLGDVDLQKLSDDELMSLGIELMQKSLLQVFNKDAKEHDDYMIYMQEHRRRRDNIA